VSNGELDQAAGDGRGEDDTFPMMREEDGEHIMKNI
jgi:hypothetical protein